MSTPGYNSFQVKDKTIVANGKTFTLAGIVSVRREARFKFPLFFISLALFGLVLAGAGVQDETAQRDRQTMEYGRNYAAAAQRVKEIGNANNFAGDAYHKALTEMESTQHIDISMALDSDAKMKTAGESLFVFGLLLPWVLGKKHCVLVSTGGQESCVYKAKTKDEADKIVSDVAAKIG
jgi:hypothetical protein